MDIGVFQPMKNAHQKKLREALRKGNLTFNRRDFAEVFQEIFTEGFSAASDTARHVGERYHDILSSSTRQGLKHIRNIVNGAILLEDVITKYVDDRRSRIEKGYDQRKRGKRAKPVGDYIHNVSLQELLDQQEEFIAEGCEKNRKSQIRSTRSIILREIESLKGDWRATLHNFFLPHTHDDPCSMTNQQLDESATLQLPILL